MKNVCKKTNTIIVIMIFTLFAIFLMTGISCATYTRTKAQLKERCLIEFGSELRLLVKYDNIATNGDINFLSYFIGNQKLTFYCYILSYHQDNNTTYSYTGEASVTYDFEAGHHYKIKYNLIKENNKTYIELYAIDLGTKTAVYNNGVYTGVHFTVGPNLGSGGLSYVNIGLDLGVKLVVDIESPIVLSLNTGVDIGFSEGATEEVNNNNINMPFSCPLGVYVGLFGKFYIPGTNISIGGGYGYRSESIGTPSPFDNFYSPFWRGDISYSNFGLYFEQYFNPEHIDNRLTGTPNIFKNWGVGFFARF